MRHSLFKYFDDMRWAEAFIEGELLFRSLSYFQAFEDEDVRRDMDEGRSIFEPAEGLVMTNQTRGGIHTMPGWRFESEVKADEIFILCASKSRSERHRQSFNAVACVEVTNIRALCQRIEAAVPPGATFFGRPVQYYRKPDGPSPRWALPELIAVSKLAAYGWQDEYRLLFSATDALAFENVSLRLASGEPEHPQHRNDYPQYPLSLGGLSDICRLHRF